MRSTLIMILAICWTTACALSAAPPRMLMQGAVAHDPDEAGGSRTSYAMMRLPEGRFAFYDRGNPSTKPLTLPDREGRAVTLLPPPPAELLAKEILQSGVLANVQVIATQDRQVLGVTVKGELIEKADIPKIGLPRYLNVWFQAASVKEVREPIMVWRGYNGSQMEYEQLPSGRLLVPYGSFRPHGKTVPPTGRHETIIQYSDDVGKSWNESRSKLVSPCYAGFNGSNEGACEPTIERLNDGRIWMLMRTQAGFLYESYSADEGTSWEKARPSRFSTSTGPANILRHSNGWLVVTWNNCELPPRANGQGVYGGRDALHIAVSDDEGRTWRGFREIYLDHRRNENPTKTGDRGTAYPLGAYTSDGQIVILAGQGAGGRNPIVVDPDWIVETEASTDFSDGLNQWSVYKHFGPAQGWWRARAVGCELVDHPSEPGRKCLHVRKPDELPADGATWNFPNGWSGVLTARVMIKSGWQGGTICLNDRMFDPSNDFGEDFAVFRVPIPASGAMGSAVLTKDQWHEVTLTWDLDSTDCQVHVDGNSAGAVSRQNPTLNGISYVRFRSGASDVDRAGYLVDRVSVKLRQTHSPACSIDDQIAQERWYVDHVVPTWTKTAE